MKFLFLITVLLSAKVNYAGSQLTKIENFGPNKGNLEMYIYIPDNLPNKNVSLVIALHGCSQNAKTIAEQSGWNTLAEKHRFIVIYPQQKRINNPSNCFNWFHSKDIEINKGENSSIKNMIEYSFVNYDIDSSNIFIYGLSAGAAMSVIMLANYPNTFRSGAILAGGPYNIANSSLENLKTMRKPPNLTPKEWGNIITKNHPDSTIYPNLVILHGESDKIVSIRNSYALIDQWSYLLQIDTIPLQVNSSFADNILVKKHIYGNTENLKTIVFYTIADTGHTLPVDPGEGEKQGGKTGLFATDKNFFSTYYIAKDFGIIKVQDK